jgi:hypothetical protein
VETELLLILKLGIQYLCLCSYAPSGATWHCVL